VKDHPALVILGLVLLIPVSVVVGIVVGLVYGWLGHALPGPALTPVTMLLVGIPYAAYRYKKPSQPV